MSKKNYSTTALLIMSAMATGIATIVPAYAGQPPVKISVMTWDGSDLIVKGIFDAAVKQFEKSHPNVTVQIQNVTYSNYFTKLQTELAAGSPPDIFELGESDWQKYWDAGTLVNLNTMSKGKSAYLANNLYPSLRKLATEKGNLAVIPVGPAVAAMLYNKDLFKAAKVPFPKNNWTWNQFAADARKLTKSTNGKTTQWGALMPASSDYIEPLVVGKGGSLLSHNGSTATGYLNSPVTVNTFQWYVNLAKQVSPSPAQQTAMNGIDLFGTDRVAIDYTGPWSVQTYQANKKMHFGVVEVPRYPGKKNLDFLYCAGYGISSKSPNQQLAWEFMNTLLDPRAAVGKMWVNHGLPSERALANSPVYKQANWKPFVAELPNTVNSAYFQNPNFRSAQSEYLNPGITQMLNQNVDVKQSLSTLAGQLDSYFKQQSNG